MVNHGRSLVLGFAVCPLRTTLTEAPRLVLLILTWLGTALAVHAPVWLLCLPVEAFAPVVGLVLALGLLVAHKTSPVALKGYRSTIS